MMKKLVFMLALVMLVGTVMTSASAITTIGGFQLRNAIQWIPAPSLEDYSKENITTYADMQDHSYCYIYSYSGKSDAIRKIVPEYVNMLITQLGFTQVDYVSSNKGQIVYAFEAPSASISEYGFKANLFGGLGNAITGATAPPLIVDVEGERKNPLFFVSDDDEGWRVDGHLIICYTDSNVWLYQSACLALYWDENSTLRTAYQPPKTTTTKSTGSGGSSGGSKKSGTKTCPKCHGTGICQLCHGTGSAPGSFGDYGVPCQTWCSRCSGLGIIPN